MREICVVFLALWGLLTEPTGSLADAGRVFDSHRREVNRIEAVVTQDIALGWVTPGASAELMSNRSGNHRLTGRAHADYDAVAGLLAAIPARDLAITRDAQRQRVTYMRFVLFEPGLFGSSKPVMAEWFGTEEMRRIEDFRNCRKTALPRWYVCTFDP